MHLNVIDVMRIDPGTIHHVFEQDLLSWGMRMGDGDGIRGVIGGRVDNDTKDAIIVGLGILKTLENDGADPITSAVAIRIIVVCLAVPRFGEELASA